MDKILLIIRREFATRVRKRSFIIMTILGPLLSAGLFILPAYLATLPDDTKTITVLARSVLLDYDRGNEDVTFRYLPPKDYNLKKAREYFIQKGDYALLYIPFSEGGDPDFLVRNTLLFSKGDVNPAIENYIENTLEKYIQKEKLKSLGVEPDIIARTKSRVNIRTFDISDGTETEGRTLLKMGIGYVAAFLIYFFVFVYGAQVMRGVIEEKTNRIVEVMISSVKPFQLMLGKILGLALVALLQFAIWIGFGLFFYFLAATFILGDALDAANVAQQGLGNSENSAVIEIFRSFNSLPFTRIFLSFIVYFIFGYLLYAAMFAAIGSAVDKESDTQQFLLPVSLPLIAGIVVLFRALGNPEGPIAVWFSMIPFTSPIVMMARVPFEASVPVYEIIISMVILILSFILMTWIAARIYRTGILMYGKKPNFRELIKWISYRN